MEGQDRVDAEGVEKDAVTAAENGLFAELEGEADAGHEVILFAEEGAASFLIDPGKAAERPKLGDGDLGDRVAGVVGASGGVDGVGGGGVEFGLEAVVAFVDGGFEFVAKADVEGEAFAEFPIVVDVEAEVFILEGGVGGDFHGAGGDAEEHGGEVLADGGGGGVIEGSAGEVSIERKIGGDADGAAIVEAAIDAEFGAEADGMVADELGDIGGGGVGEGGVDTVAGIFPRRELRVGSGRDAGERGLAFLGQVDEGGTEAERGEIHAAGGAVLPPFRGGEAVAKVEDGGGVEDYDIVDRGTAIGPVLVDAVDLVEKVVVLVFLPEIIMTRRKTR